MSAVLDWGGLFLLYEQADVTAEGLFQLPNGLASYLGDRPVLAPSTDAALALYANDRWETVSQCWEQLPETRREVQTFLELVRSNALACPVEKGGFIRLPDDLRALAGIDDAVLPVRASDHLELWNPETWLELREQSASVAAHGAA